MNDMAIEQSTNGLRELALFAGAGGGILGGHLLGWRTICAVERDAYAAGVLAQRQNDGILAPFPIWSDVTTFDGKPWRGRVDVISGGFPCQDISAAGRGEGISGARSGLWSEFARIIGEVRPRYVFVENSPILTSRGLGLVLGDLAAMGYDAEWGVLGAADVGHRTSGTESGLWPTPTVCGNYNRKGASKTSGDGLATVVKKWPTPTAHDAKDTGTAPSEGQRNTPGLPFQAGGTLNPAWVEWLMGWPIGWTDLKPLEMDKFQWWQQQHSIT